MTGKMLAANLAALAALTTLAICFVLAGRSSRAFSVYETAVRIRCFDKRRPTRVSAVADKGKAARTLGRRRYNIDLSAHLAECDGNYLRLTHLMPDIESSDRRDFRVLASPGAHAPSSATLVSLEVLDRHRHTTVIALRQWAAPNSPETHIKIRLYHDARSAEVIEFQGQRLFDAEYGYPNPKMRQPDEKAQVNRFLREFLNNCLAHGLASEEPVLPVTSDSLDP